MGLRIANVRRGEKERESERESTFLSFTDGRIIGSCDTSIQHVLVFLTKIRNTVQKCPWNNKTKKKKRFIYCAMT